MEINKPRKLAKNLHSAEIIIFEFTTSARAAHKHYLKYFRVDFLNFPIKRKRWSSYKAQVGPVVRSHKLPVLVRISHSTRFSAFKLSLLRKTLRSLSSSTRNCGDRSVKAVKKYQSHSNLISLSS